MAKGQAKETLDELIEKARQEKEAEAKAILDKAFKDLQAIGFRVVPRISLDGDGLTDYGFTLKPIQPRPK